MTETQNGIICLFIGIFAGACLVGGQWVRDYHRAEALETKLEQAQDRLTIAEDTLSLVFKKPWNPEKLRMEEVTVTAYSSTRGQTDDNPWETSTGEHVGPSGAALSRDLPVPDGTTVLAVDIGTVIINDTTNRRCKKTLDIWVGSTQAARAFGRQTTTLLWLEA